ncbi:Exocyst complex, component Exoc1 [Pseudohyphozyma bogoriensis]|nr:Exocyst complex, component Exoc1 [Pseudohyphozyma bogoriensis]
MSLSAGSSSGPPDKTRAIIASLFTSQPGQPPHPEQHVAHVQTFEGVPGSPQRKARYLIISAVKDGRLKLHKAKENSNGSFSIGKTWPLEELRSIEVGKPLEFTLSMNGKTYRYETELPSSHQAAFLVKMVRCWRTYMAGRGQPDLVLVGFSVDTNRPGTPSRPSTSSQGGGTGPYPSSQPSATRDGFHPNSSSTSTASSRPFTPSASQTRPSTAASVRTVNSVYPSSSPPPTAPSGRRPSAANIAPGALPSSSYRMGGGGSPPRPSTAQSTRVISPPPPSQSAPPPQGPQVRSGSAASIVRPSTAAREDSFSSMTARSNSADQGRPSAMDPRSRNGSGSEGPRAGAGSGPPSKANADMSSYTGGGMPSKKGPPKQRGRLMSTAGPPPTAPVVPKQPVPAMPPTVEIVAPTPRKKIAAVDDLIDDDAVLSNVEEMLEGFEWRGVAEARRTGGKADEIEKRLVGELKALEAASIHAIMESDDRVNFVIKNLDDALAELDKLDLMIGLYKTQLNLMNDDIAHIESQNRGLQVQTSNQRMLLSEIDNLLETIHIPEKDLTALSQQSLENQEGIEKLERAGVSLYKALLSTRDTAVGDMAAASERVGEYRSKATHFSKRIFDFLAVMFKFQVDLILNPKDGTKPKPGLLPSHATLEDFLGRYCGLMLFVKEIDNSRYQQICSAYFSAMSELYRRESQELIQVFRGMIRKPTEDELEAGFTSTRDSPTIRQQSMRRVGTVVGRSPAEGRPKDQSGKINGSEAFDRALTQLTPAIIREQGFISDFLSINELDASITFADYMQLETFFRRGATTYLVQQQGKLKDIKSAMEAVFGFLEVELRDWINALLRSDGMQIIGVLAALDKAMLEAAKERNDFLNRLLQKQYQKSLAVLESSCKDQIKNIEQTKLTLKKRKGVVPFVRVFPLFVHRVEDQLKGADKLNIRALVDENYERVVTTIYDSLQQMAKMDGEGHGVAAEDKDQLNYHVIIIENMHHIITVFSKQNVPALASFVSQAREKYTQNLELYIKLDFFQGLETLLRTTPPTEVSLHSAYTRQALRRTTSDVRSKDLRKAVDALYKRVDKHFGDVENPSAEHAVVIKTVWKACEEEMLRLTATWKGLIDKCYPDERAGLEFTRDDVREFFAKAHVS